MRDRHEFCSPLDAVATAAESWADIFERDAEVIDETVRQRAAGVRLFAGWIRVQGMRKQ